MFYTIIVLHAAAALAVATSPVKKHYKSSKIGT